MKMPGMSVEVRAPYDGRLTDTVEAGGAALDEAIGRANALPWAFQAAVFTRDYATAMRAYARLDASAVMLNDHTAFCVDWMPFADLRQAGLGVGGIPYTFREMQTEKLFVGLSP